MAVANLVAKVDAQVATFQKQFAEASRTAQKFEKDFANTASSVTAQQKRISDAFASFSGDRLAREATAVAKAVEQIGGAARLTASEQARVNSVMTEALAKYQALGQQAPKALLDLEAATRKLETTTTSTHRTTSLFGQSLDTLENKGSLSGQAMDVLTGTFGKFTAAGVAVNIINRLGGELARMVERGAQIAPLQDSFERLATGVGESSQGMLRAMGSATRGLVEDFDLMQSANKALLLGLPTTSESMANLAKTATVLGKAMGQDATKSLDDLIVALGRSSPLILDNLGLTVKVEDANRKYAAQLGKTADALTDAEKKQAFMNEAMRKADERVKQIGEQSLTLTEHAKTAVVSLSNIVTAAIGAVNRAGGEMVTEGGAALKGIGGFFSDVYHNGLRASIAVRGLNDAMASTARAGAAIGGGAGASAAVETLSARVQRLREDLAQLTAQQRKNIEAGQLLGKSNREIADSQAGISGTVKLTEEHLALLEKIQRQQADAQRKGAEAAREHTRKLKEEAEAFRDLIAPMVTITKGMGDLKQILPGVVSPDVISGWSRLEEEMALVSDRVREMANHPLTALPGVAVKLPQVTLPQTFMQRLFDPTQIGAALGNAISGAVQGGGNVLNAAAGALGQGLTSKFAAFLTGAKEAGGLAIGGFLGGAINAALPGLGALLGPLVGKISSKIAEAFGGPSKDELLGRDVVEKFEQALQGTLSAATKLAAGNESWKLTTIAVRDAYVAAGRSATEAEAAVKKLWDSSRGGADQARLAVLEIQAVMDAAASRQQRLNDSLTDSIEVNLDGLGSTASDAAREIEEALRNIRIEPIRIPIEIPGLSSEIPALAKGGIVRQPTLALIGEAGPEAVVPLSGGGGGVPAMAPIENRIFLDGREVTEALGPHLPHFVRRRV